MIRTAALAAAALLATLPALGQDRVTGNALVALFADTSVAYDYGGGLRAFAYTKPNGVNFFDMDGNQASFSETRPIVKTQVTIKGDQVCFEAGWISCWVFETTEDPATFVGLHADDGSFNAVMTLTGRGDTRRIERRFLAQ